MAIPTTTVIDEQKDRQTEKEYATLSFEEQADLHALVMDRRVKQADQIKETQKMSKYDREIQIKFALNVDTGERVLLSQKTKYFVDVYRLLDAFNTGDAAIDHAIKKLLASGKRGYKDSIQDKEEAIVTIQESIKIEKSKNGQS